MSNTGNMLVFDLDGVFVDFCRAVYKLHNRPYEGFEPPHFDFYEDWGITSDEFWAPVDAEGPEWWANLPLYPWAEELRQIGYSFPGEVRVATACSRHPHSSAGKVSALQSIFGAKFRDYHITPRKWDLSAPGRILIDDYEVNCDKWEAAGGKAILFPQPWNDLRALVDGDEKIEYVKASVEELLHATI